MSTGTRRQGRVPGPGLACAEGRAGVLWSQAGENSNRIHREPIPGLVLWARGSRCGTGGTLSPHRRGLHASKGVRFIFGVYTCFWNLGPLAQHHSVCFWSRLGRRALLHSSCLVGGGGSESAQVVEREGPACRMWAHGILPGAPSPGVWQGEPPTQPRAEPTAAVQADLGRGALCVHAPAVCPDVRVCMSARV